jgi:hypothetical protein
MSKAQTPSITQQIECPFSQAESVLFLRKKSCFTNTITHIITILSIMTLDLQLLPATKLFKNLSLNTKTKGIPPLSSP